MIQTLFDHPYDQKSSCVGYDCSDDLLPVFFDTFGEIEEGLLRFKLDEKTSNAGWEVYKMGKGTVKKPNRP